MWFIFGSSGSDSGSGCGSYKGSDNSCGSDNGSCGSGGGSGVGSGGGSGVGFGGGRNLRLVRLNSNVSDIDIVYKHELLIDMTNVPLFFIFSCYYIATISTFY